MKVLRQMMRFYGMALDTFTSLTLVMEDLLVINLTFQLRVIMLPVVVAVVVVEVVVDVVVAAAETVRQYDAFEGAQCGLSPEQRFTFYDHVHTTGMDIKQPLLCTAALTLSKDRSQGCWLVDMTLRDYAQGAYRMRGIGHGQRIEVLLTPEVRSLMNKSLSSVEHVSEEDFLLAQLLVREKNTYFSHQVAMDERDARTKSQLALSHWLKAGLCYIMVADAFLSVAAYLSMMPQYLGRSRFSVRFDSF
eukprot:symbB.v1.2.026765.t1/scaffold2701.1/size72746/3